MITFISRPKHLRHRQAWDTMYAQLSAAHPSGDGFFMRYHPRARLYEGVIVLLEENHLVFRRLMVDKRMRPCDLILWLDKPPKGV